MGYLKRVYALGIVLIVAGSIMVFLGGLSSPSSSPSSSSSSFSVAGVIFIGPFPIVFGSGPNSVLLILIGLFIVGLMIAISVVSMITWRRRSSEVG